MRGGYLLFLELTSPKTLQVGRLGTHEFPAGLYVYAGSALGGLESRVGRHLSKEKTKRWHIDYLTEVAEPLDVYAFESSKRIECELAGAVKRLGGKHHMAGFGASDCGCESHLLYLGEPRAASTQSSRTCGT